MFGLYSVLLPKKMLPKKIELKGVLIVVIGLMVWSGNARSVYGQKLEDVFGIYRRQPVENGWHEGTIEFKEGTRKQEVQWRNKAGKTWNLIPALEEGKLKTDATCPYFNNGQTAFELKKRGNEVIGFRFNNDLFLRDGVELVAQRSGGFHGYISMKAQSPPEGYGYGASFYVSIWPLIQEPMNGFQIGLPSTWIVPDNRNFKQPLCPPGTVARDNWPKRGPYYRSVFQTIEGGLGYWASTRFPSRTPKYRMNGTPNGYNHEISSPGWGFGKTQSLGPEKMGIAQLSNRLVVPPDGMTFQDVGRVKILGNAWMSLKLSSKKESKKSTPTGEQSWTLFLNTKNFKGPVAFWIPETWSRLSRDYRTIENRGLDARPGLMGGGAMEVNTVPFFESSSNDGTVFSRIPPIQFPVNREGATVLMQDVMFYRKNALGASGKFSQNKSWRPQLTARPISFNQGREKKKLERIGKTVQTKIFGEPGNQAFGLQWNVDKNHKAVRVLPEYFQEIGDKRVAIAQSRVPESTLLIGQEFDKGKRNHVYQSPDSGVWTDPGPSSKTFQAKLTDGSIVTYAWFRFVDQPSIQALGWDAEEREKVQRRVERIHEKWLIHREYIPPPTNGELVSIDDAILVDPPVGMEVGFVPIVIRQELE